MSKNKNYIFNDRTLMYEIRKRSRVSQVFKSASILALSLAMSVLYFWLYTSVFGLVVMNRQLDGYEDALASLQMRDDDIYRSIFGMHEIPAEVRNAGFGGVNRYDYLDGLDGSGLLKSTTDRMDVLTKKSYVQSKSFDEVAQLSKRAGDMASCIPAIPPINPDPSNYRLSSGFGFRGDPVYGRTLP